VRWDRAARTGLLAVLIVVAGLYVQQGIRLLSTHSEAQHQLDVVQSLARQNRQLAAQQRSLSDPATIQQDARALGMVRPGERPYVVTGLSKR
jgi:cell division protein FtsB